MNKTSLLESSLAEKYRQECIVWGLLYKTANEIEMKMQSWQYCKGKHRFVDGKRYNLRYIRVEASPYGLLIHVRACFVIDESHLRPGKRLDAVREIDRWAVNIPYRTPGSLNKYGDVFFDETKEATLNEVLTYGPHLLEIK